jgi:ribosomal-protein-alanine N-acetyltransferase
MENLPLVIRRMQESDIPQVHEIDTLSLSLPWSERSYHFEVTENRAARPWVVEATCPDGSQRLAAMMVLWLILDEAHIATVAVHPDFRRKGIGLRLVAHALVDAAENGARTGYLEVRAGNFSAQDLYKKLGFHVEGVRPRYYRDNHEDALLMMLENIDAQVLQAFA